MPYDVTYTWNQIYGYKGAYKRETDSRIKGMWLPSGEGGGGA